MRNDKKYIFDTNVWRYYSHIHAKFINLLHMPMSCRDILISEHPFSKYVSVGT